MLALLWEFPHVPGHLEVPQAVAWAESQGLQVTDIRKTMEKKHIFTHIEWKMHGILLEVREQAGPFIGVDLHRMDEQEALPTAFRQFREDLDHV